VGAKEIARKIFFSARREHLPTDKLSADRAIHAQLSRLLEDLKVHSNKQKSVMAYRPLPSEADPFLGQVDERFFYPRVVAANLQARQIRSAGDFEKSSFGVQEPRESTELVAASQIAAVLVPGIAFDRHGTRLGFGKGFYDRFLKQTRDAVRIGVAYAFQVSTQDLPVDEWDEPIDWIVSDRFILHVEMKG
jgi:5-formyltetrahydrofolate cyclo-ligase